MLGNGLIREGTAGRVKTAETFPKYPPHHSMFKRKSFLIETNEREKSFFEHRLRIGRVLPFVNPVRVLMDS